MACLDTLWQKVSNDYYLSDTEALQQIADYQSTESQRQQALIQSRQWVTQLRRNKQSSLMEVFLAEYGLSSSEGVALMCLAEALLRVPDAATIDALIEDKIADSDWQHHVSQSPSFLVNASSWSLMLTGRLLHNQQQTRNHLSDSLRSMLKRLGEPVIRQLIRQGMLILANQFILAEDMPKALKRSRTRTHKGYTYSFDMLGEAAINAQGVADYYLAYKQAIATIIEFNQQHPGQQTIAEQHGISIKLSALHARLEWTQQKRVVDELVPLVIELCCDAAAGNIGLNIDAEESDRLELMLLVFSRVLESSELKKYPAWKGLGLVVQAYAKRCWAVIDYIYELAQYHHRPLMLRLVKGAYWDTEIKKAQELGVKGYPVFSHKCFSDTNYLACAQKILSYQDWLYPQFATHNAHTIVAILAMKPDPSRFEFQQLHGMGESIYALIRAETDCRCRIYAPVGKHTDLLAYLVRRLLENGANSSFVNQVQNLKLSVEEVITDPIEETKLRLSDPHGWLVRPDQIFAPRRDNSQGWNIQWSRHYQQLQQGRDKWQNHHWKCHSLVIDNQPLVHQQQPIINPAVATDRVATASLVKGHQATLNNLAKTWVEAAECWQDSLTKRRQVLLKVAHILEQNRDEIFALLQREAGKTLADAIAELREAVDFLRFYTTQARSHKPRGCVVCISPWNFPLAIFTGQVAAALITANAVIAKPAESTPTIAYRLVEWFHQAGVPKPCLQLALGDGDLGSALIKQAKVRGVLFTGSTQTAHAIHRNLAKNLAPDSLLIAETGGINAMLVDSTALLEQAVKDIIASAFQTAGQRCSALRLLLVQEDIEEALMNMLQGALAEQRVANPWQLDSDIGPLINPPAKQKICEYLEQHREQIIYPHNIDRMLNNPNQDLFMPPTIILINTIDQLDQEIFGPVLHVLSVKESNLHTLVDKIHQLGFGLTFGLHTRIDERIQFFANHLQMGNIYVNRNQIGAVVGCQPFGGEGMSGTGPKAGGYQYLSKLYRSKQKLAYELPAQQPASSHLMNPTDKKSRQQVQDLIDQVRHTFQPMHCLSRNYLSGVTGESNCLSYYPKGVILCLGPTPAAINQQTRRAEQQGCPTVAVTINELQIDDLSQLQGFAGVVFWPESQFDWQLARTLRIALANRSGSILALWTEIDFCCQHERHLCINTTASGGNLELLSSQPI